MACIDFRGLATCLAEAGGDVVQSAEDQVGEEDHDQDHTSDGEGEGLEALAGDLGD